MGAHLITTVENHSFFKNLPCYNTMKGNGSYMLKFDDQQINADLKDLRVR